MVAIYDDNYAEAFALESYYIDEAMNQRSILNFVTECICLESGDYNRIRAINESAADSIKGFFSKIGEFIKGVFNKFRERVAELVTTDKVFLEKYKDIILKKEWKDHSIDGAYMYKPDNLTSIVNHRINVDADLAAIDKLVWVEGSAKEFTEEMFIEHADTGLSNFKTKFKTNEISELVTFAIKGQDTQDGIQAAVIYKKEEMYQFCSKFEAIKNQLSQNEADLEKVQGKIISAIGKKENEARLKEEQQPKETTEEVGNDAAIYSNVYGGYISEGMKVGPAANEGKSGTSNNAGTSGAQDKRVKISGTDTAKEAINNKEGTSNELKAYVDAYRNYFKYLVDIQTNAMTVGTAMYKDYMKLLRVHVRDYVGDQGAEAHSNVGNDATPKKEENTEGNKSRFQFGNKKNK